MSAFNIMRTVCFEALIFVVGKPQVIRLSSTHQQKSREKVGIKNWKK